MKVSGTVEQIFAQAVALEQNGLLKNTIYAIKNSIYILNYDHTVLLRFRLRMTEGTFDNPIAIKANDYDSNEFHEEDGKIIFTIENSGYVRKKTCGTPDLTPEDVAQLFLNYADRENAPIVQSVTLSENILPLLDRDLSHIEFSGEAGQPLKIVQRNIYSGGIIEITKNDQEGFFNENLTKDIEPIAIKTNDFFALFNFQENLIFNFCENEGQFIQVSGVNKTKRNINGIIACCLYDEISKIKEAHNGRKK